MTIQNRGKHDYSFGPIRTANETFHSSNYHDVLVCVILDEPNNLRVNSNDKFYKAYLEFLIYGGLECVSSLLEESSPVSVKMKILKFLYFYLIPEPDSTSFH